jgi:hypothetical protein
MRNRIPAAVVLVVAMLASIAAVSGCASNAASSASGPSGAKPTTGSSPSSDPSTGTSASSPPVMGGGGAAPNIPVVRLGTAFNPKTLQLGAGQKFVVIVDSSDKATGSGISGACTPAAAASFSSHLLSLQCQGSSYLYTTRHAGSADLSVSVRPNCATGAMCPQWMASARLTVTISG